LREAINRRDDVSGFGRDKGGSTSRWHRWVLGSEDTQKEKRKKREEKAAIRWHHSQQPRGRLLCFLKIR
jgi:hypothetical protein